MLHASLVATRTVHRFCFFSAEQQMARYFSQLFGTFLLRIGTTTEGLSARWPSGTDDHNLFGAACMILIDFQNVIYDHTFK